MTPSHACTQEAAAGGQAAEDEDLDSGVMEWAHLSDPTFSPDAVWSMVPSHIRYGVGLGVEGWTGWYHQHQTSLIKS